MDLKKRAFISIRINGKRHREYNGNRIRKNIKPNLTKSIKDRNRLLKKLEFEFQKSIESGEYLRLISDATVPTALKDLLEQALKQKQTSNLTPKYIKAISTTHQDFLSFLNDKEKDGPLDRLPTKRVQEYLNRFRHTPTFYMSRRKELASLFNSIKKIHGLDFNPVTDTEKIKIKARLHKIYNKEQMAAVLDYLKENYENLYLCCLISYGCFLRPHIEVRNLKGHHFKADCTEIHLSGDENKSGKIRITYIPEYVRSEIYDRVKSLKYSENLFSGNEQPFNEYYFKTVWSRAFRKMMEMGIVEKDQTMYSFRHTAAVEVYRKTKDLHILQQLLGHSDMIVTLKYLRGLGVNSMEEMKAVMPAL